MSRKNKLTNNDFLPIPTPVEPIISVKSLSSSLEYNVVVTANDITLFATTVNNHLNNGWKLQGGISLSHITTDYNVTAIYAQAITRTS